MKCSLWWGSPSWSAGCAGQCQSLCQGLWCLPAPTAMGSTKQHPRVQPGPGSLQCWSLLQATPGIKSQLHTSAKAKHYRLQLLSFLCRGHSSRGWHRTQASQNCRVWILAPHWASSTARALTKHSSALAEVSHCSPCPGTQGGTGGRLTLLPQHLLCIAAVRIPICSRNKGRKCLAAPCCSSCFPLSALTSDVRCHILYFMWNAVTSSCLTQAMANFLLQISCEGARLCNSPGSKCDRLQQSQPKTRERAQKNYRGWGRKCYIHNKII